MKILLTNDDGIFAPGLWALYHRFADQHDVTVIAPDRERSAVGHGITLHEPLRFNRVEINGFRGHAVNGTPADCVKLGILEILAQKPDLVLSGINPGANVGVNINYSGTVSAAKEAALNGIAAIAVSVEMGGSRLYDDIARFAVDLARQVAANGLPAGTLLNVNVPNVSFDEITGIQICKHGVFPLTESFEKRIDPWQRTYYWPGAPTPFPLREKDDLDEVALARKRIAITPIKCDMTDYDLFENLKRWQIQSPPRRHRPQTD